MSSPRSEVRDRIRGLYGIVDASLTDDVVRTGRAFVAAGVRLLQLRAKGWSDDEVLRAARALAGPCREAGCTFLVNDLPEVARAAGADGVHVGQTDGEPGAVRRALGEDLILGRSTGAGVPLAHAARGADYLAFGPVFATPRLSRPKEVVGLDALRAARLALAGSVPLVAIGGITPDTLPLVRATGVGCWAVIGALHGEDPAAAVRALS
jgi:thiamine-phosphate diphosphorylase